jgi:uncharacterized protein involved in exopolysaccharide biosynthesis
MELTAILKILWSRKFVVALVVVLACGAAFGARQLAKSTPTGAATVQILVDSPQSALADLLQNTAPLTTRAALLAQVMASQVVLEDVAHAAGVPVAQLTAQGPYSGSGEVLDTITPSEARASQLLGERSRYRLAFVAQPDEPIVTVSVQGSDPAAAGRVAEAVLPGVQRFLATLQEEDPTHPTQPAQRVTIRQLGAAQVGTVNSSSRTALTAVAGLGVLLFGLLLLLGIEVLRRPPMQEAEAAPSASGSSGSSRSEQEHESERDLAAVG